MLTCIEPNFRDLGGEDGQESEEGKESKEDSQKEKEVTRFEKLMRPIGAFRKYIQAIATFDSVSAQQTIGPGLCADGCRIKARFFVERA
jgi:hypothetical protein